MPRPIQMPPQRGAPVFEMQFPLGEVADYAGRYAYADDHQVLAIGAAARDRGFFTREEFLIVCAWKTHRSKRLTEINSAEEVQAATRAGMARGGTGWQEINALRTLTGVDVRTASVFLHLTDIDRWPILDVRALHALGVPEPSSYGRRLWEAFVSTWRTLREQAAVDGRPGAVAVVQGAPGHLAFQERLFMAVCSLSDQLVSCRLEPEDASSRTPAAPSGRADWKR